VCEEIEVAFDRSSSWLNDGAPKFLYDLNSKWNRLESFNSSFRLQFLKPFLSLGSEVEGKINRWEDSENNLSDTIRLNVRSHVRFLQCVLQSLWALSQSQKMSQKRPKVIRFLFSDHKQEDLKQSRSHPISLRHLKLDYLLFFKLISKATILKWYIHSKIINGHLLDVDRQWVICLKSVW
jgi:hypothetical protein